MDKWEIKDGQEGVGGLEIVGWLGRVGGLGIVGDQCWTREHAWTRDSGWTKGSRVRKKVFSAELWYTIRLYGYMIIGTLKEIQILKTKRKQKSGT